jgi:hypothetical protein
MERVEPEAGTLPVPDQPVQTYRVPAGPDRGEPDSVAFICVPSLTHSLFGAGEPYGEFTVSMYWWVQEAVSFMGPLIVIVGEGVEPVKLPVPEPIHPSRTYSSPVALGGGEVDIVTFVPTPYQAVPDGEVVPKFVDSISLYSVVQLQVMVEGRIIVNVQDVDAPEEGTLPVPSQPVQEYCIPVSIEIGESIDSVTEDPLSNQPLTGLGLPFEDVTVK